ncbi:MAG: polysaccharide lyase family 8 super-sandwich domain-containing protein [Bacteroidales bacterium]
MKHKFRVTIFCLAIPLLLQAQDDFQTVRNRVVDAILQEQVNDDRVNRIVESIRADGSWPGIDYSDVSNTGFEHVIHLRNMVSMSLAYRKETSVYYMDPELKALIQRSLEFWVGNDFICENWWYNQIGTPQSLVTVLLMMDGEIDPGLKAGALNIAGRANLNAPGARPGGDRIKIAGIAAKRILATGDTTRFREIIRAINKEIKFNTGDRGIQKDFSFHHRVDRVNNSVSYGRGYAAAFAEWAEYVNGTSYAFSEEKIRLLVDYYLDGICKQFIYGIYTDPGVKNRDVSRRDAFRPNGTSIPEALLHVTCYRNEDLEEIVRLRKGAIDPSDTFCKFFWQTEHFVCQRPGFYTSVRMYSVRNRNMEEPYNSEGLKNHHKADGASFLSLRGDEYMNIWPVYDWQKIPGTTVLQKSVLPPPEEIQKDGLSGFVGGVTDGVCGAVGFDFISPHDGIRARKAWFFFNELYVCLGAGIESTSRFPVATTLNQCLLNGEVTLLDEEGERSLPKGVHSLRKVQWIHHDGTGYFFPDPAEVQLSNCRETGCWWDISRQWDTPRDTVAMDVFKLWIDHGSRPQGRRGGLVNEPMIAKDVTYGYVVIPGIRVEEMNPGRQVEILVNNRWIQAVADREQGLVEVIFYRAGSVGLTDQLELEADGPGAVMVQMKEGVLTSVTAADPSRTLSRMHLQVHGPTPDEEIVINLPGGDDSGRSVTVKL